MERKKQPEPLEHLIQGVLPGHVARRMPPKRLLRAWSEAVGDYLAQKTRPLTVTQEGELVVSVEGAALRQELSLMRAMILEDLKDDGFDLHGIKLVNQRAAAPPPEPEPVLPELDRGEEDALAREVERVKDPELRGSLAAFRRAMLRSRKAGRK